MSSPEDKTMRRMRTYTFLVYAYSLFAFPASSQGTPALLRCSFNGGLDVYARPEPSSPIIARLKCGDRLAVIDASGFPHIRTQDGKDGFILSHNLGQWSIVPETSPSSTDPARPTAGPITSSTAATTLNQTSSPNVQTPTPNGPPPSPKVPISSPSVSTTEPRPTAIEPVPPAPARRETGRTKLSEVKI